MIRRWWSCISFDSYIKPQLRSRMCLLRRVVYLLIPTSNHNFDWTFHAALLLYIFWFLHQTTTLRLHTINQLRLYIFWFLHQTTTENMPFKKLGWLYIFWFLHQTTTFAMLLSFLLCCISFNSYIKPQPSSYTVNPGCVVYLLIPTSNHNTILDPSFDDALYIFWFLHQTTTIMSALL